ncbi:MAG: MarR family transcriptional regulator [Candidatus Nanopelagicales bacterium]|jgi:DNA-binding MarR family transcriptional regulator|nr:MarR family transcriptional regulator [Candidatus Nanopelagicales bacterium]MCU0299032.1 MarR family transcriptional regulator [Candidatus Nanopelagicales bacterium]
MKSPDNPLLGATTSVQLFRTVIVLASHLRVGMDQRLADIDLTTQQVAVLTVVEAAAEPPTLGEVAAVLGTSHQNVRQIASLLERKGLLTVVVDVSDRRVRRLDVTPAVAALFEGRDPADHRAVEEWMSVLSPEEQEHAVALLGRVLEGLRA